MVNALLLAATLRVFGSAGAEAQLTPANTASPLNPRNIAAIPYQTNVADATAFVEAGTDDKRWKLRAKLRAESSDRGADRGEAGEALVRFAATDWLDLTAGRVIEKWGTGYGWTPTAFIGPARNPTDPNDRRSSYRGRDMVRADLFVKDTNISLYALEGGTVAGRVYRLVRGTDVSLVFHGNDFGVSVSRVFGESLELHAEVSRTPAVCPQRTDERPPAGRRGRQHWSPKAERTPLARSAVHAQTSAAGPPEASGRSSLLGELEGPCLARTAHTRAVARIVAGAQYTFANNTNVVFEVYHGTDGLTATQWDAFRDSVHGDLREANARYAPLRMARTYAFTRVAKPFRKVDAELIAITNLRDGSTLIRAAATYKLRPDVSLYILDTELIGGRRSELEYLQVARVTTLGARYHF
jgi:hypothetical protein